MYYNFNQDGEEINILVAQPNINPNDSYNYFSALDNGSLIKTGPTGTNVADVSVMIVR